MHVWRAGRVLTYHTLCHHTPYPTPYIYVLKTAVPAHAALAVIERKLEAARHMDRDSSREEFVKVMDYLEQQEHMHRKANVVARGMAEDVDPGMLCPNMTVLEHRRLWCRAARVTVPRPLWLWFATVADKHAALKHSKVLRLDCSPGGRPHARAAGRARQAPLSLPVPAGAPAPILQRSASFCQRSPAAAGGRAGAVAAGARIGGGALGGDCGGGKQWERRQPWRLRQQRLICELACYIACFASNGHLSADSTACCGCIPVALSLPTYRCMRSHDCCQAALRAPRP